MIIVEAPLFSLHSSQPWSIHSSHWPLLQTALQDLHIIATIIIKLPPSLLEVISKTENVIPVNYSISNNLFEIVYGLTDHLTITHRSPVFHWNQLFSEILPTRSSNSMMKCFQLYLNRIQRIKLIRSIYHLATTAEVKISSALHTTLRMPMRKAKHEQRLQIVLIM